MENMKEKQEANVDEQIGKQPIDLGSNPREGQGQNQAGSIFSGKSEDGQQPMAYMTFYSGEDEMNDEKGKADERPNASTTDKAEAEAANVDAPA